jgi:hypothetical protein
MTPAFKQHNISGFEQSPANAKIVYDKAKLTDKHGKQRLQLCFEAEILSQSKHYFVCA